MLTQIGQALVSRDEPRERNHCTRCAARRATTSMAQCMASGRPVCLNTRSGNVGIYIVEKGNIFISGIGCRLHGPCNEREKTASS